MHILFADDTRATALPVIRLLERHGHRVTYVTEGQAAVDAYRKERPDLVLLDVVMPVMDGIEATRRIKAMGGTRWVPLMLLTGLAEKDEVVAGFDAGADDYLVKPIVFEVLEARLRSMQRIAVMQDALFAIIDNVYKGILSIDEAGIVKSYNQAAERIFGYPAADVIGRNVKMLMPEPYAGEHDGYLSRYMRERTPRVIGVGRKVAGRRNDGEVFPLRLAVTEIKRPQGSLFIGVVSDISEEEKARARIEFLALHDPLTGLPNRAYFNDTLEQLLRERGDEAHAVLFVDLDGFKPINDTLGHDSGDAALKVAAGRIRHVLPEGDFVARLGGDEFVAIVRNLPGADAALAIAQRMLESVSLPMTLANQVCVMGASIGIAMIQQQGVTCNEVLTAADNAMYAAKRAGKGRAMLAQGMT